MLLVDKQIFKILGTSSEILCSQSTPGHSAITVVSFVIIVRGDAERAFRASNETAHPSPHARALLPPKRQTPTTRERSATHPHPQARASQTTTRKEAILSVLRPK